MHFDPAVKTTESIVASCCHNHAETKADVNARVLSHAERRIRCLGIASSDADGKSVFCFNLTFSNPLRPDTLVVIARASDLRIQVKMIIDGHVAIAKETCRVIDMGTQILTTEVIPAHEADTLGDRLGDLVESSDNFVGVHLEHDFQIVQVRWASPGGSTWGLDWEARPRASPGGARLESSTGGARFGSLRCTNSIVYQVV